MPNDPQKGIDAAIAVVEKARRYGVTEAELEHAKVQHTVSIEHRLDNKEKTRNAEYAKAIVANFCNAEPCMNIEYEAALEAEFSATVTLDDINKTLKDIITDDRSCTEERICRRQQGRCRGPHVHEEASQEG